MRPSSFLAPLSLLLTAAAVGAAAPPADPLVEGLASYVADARAIVAALDTDAPPTEQAAALEMLADRAIALVPEFSRRNPACADYLQAASALREQWHAMEPERIEADFHHDAALPAIADAAQRPVCYQMKDLVVHPLTARRLLAEPSVDRAALRHEIVEVIAHGGALAAMTAGPD